jgi:hypothetical protein
VFASRSIASASLALAAALIILGGCASTTPRPNAPSPVAASAPSDLEDADLSAAMGLLYRGDAVAARKRLLSVLSRHPADPTARSLIRQIDTPPEVVLGTESFAYTTRADDSLSLLAQRFLGDPVLFYALARYNHIEAPGVIAPGLVLRIPGHQKPEPPRISHQAEPKSAPATVQTPTPRPVAVPAPPANNPKRATQLRAAALEQLNRGEIDRAVVLFQEATRLDPANSLIRRDLERALRISRAVHAKS